MSRYKGCIGVDRWFELEHHLGSGGLAEVWSARERRTGRRVALKIAASGNVPLLEHELRALRRVQGPGVPKVETLVEVQGGACLVMEQLPGRTLRDVLLARSRARALLSPEQIAAFFGALTEVLARAHGEAVVHSDLKPCNVIVGNRADQLWIIDFNVSHIAGEPPPQTSRGIRGTPGYVAPELLRGAPIDRRADIHSLGIMLFETLTLRKLWHEGVDRHLPPPLHVGGAGCASLRECRRRMRGRRPCLSDWHLRLPRSVERVVDRCLERRPEARYDSATEVMGALRRSLAPLMRPALFEHLLLEAREAASGPQGRLPLDAARLQTGRALARRVAVASDLDTTVDEPFEISLLDGPFPPNGAWAHEVTRTL